MPKELAGNSAASAKRNMMSIAKSPGVTPTERLLADLCERSFLKLWSYPNPFKEDGKELCDLLAVFENQVFIFFDRESGHLEGDHDEPMVKWERWKRAAIDSQARTAYGAERYLRRGGEIFLDKGLAIKFPISIDRDKMVVHKIIVAHGAKEACQAASDANVYGSLAVCYGKLLGKGELSWPFFVQLDRENPIHVLDSHNLPIIFGELDTILDLSMYFDAKVDAIKRYDCLAYCGEEDLLAHYFLRFDDSKNRHFIGVDQTDINFMMVGEGEWKDFIELPVYQRKKLADKNSYLWDGIIQKTCQNALDGTLLGNATLLEGRSAIHEMAKEPRFSRRALATAMIGAIENFPDGTQPVTTNLSFMPSFYKGKAYVFLQVHVKDMTDFEGDYRRKRQALLEIACGAARNKFPHLDTVVGIAIDAPKLTQWDGEDFILMDCSNWTDDDREHYERANAGFSFFNTGRAVTRQLTTKEFPDAAPVSRHPAKVGRNDLCPCGSGRKFKKCCMGRGVVR